MGFAYKFSNPDGIYFVTSAVVEWVDAFTRSHYCDIVVSSLKHCIEKKGLVLHAWVIMPNHIHLIISRRGEASLCSECVEDQLGTSNERFESPDSNNERHRQMECLRTTFS